MSSAKVEAKTSYFHLDFWTHTTTGTHIEYFPPILCIGPPTPHLIIYQKERVLIKTVNKEQLKNEIFDFPLHNIFNYC